MDLFQPYMQLRFMSNAPTLDLQRQTETEIEMVNLQ